MVASAASRICGFVRRTGRDGRRLTPRQRQSLARTPTLPRLRLRLPRRSKPAPSRKRATGVRMLNRSLFWTRAACWETGTILPLVYWRTTGIIGAATAGKELQAGETSREIHLLVTRIGADAAQKESVLVDLVQARQHHVALIVPVYEREQEGVY